MLTRCSYWDDGWPIHVDATVKCHFDVGKFWSISRFWSGQSTSASRCAMWKRSWKCRLRGCFWYFQLHCLEENQSYFEELLFKWLWANLSSGSMQLVIGNIPISKQVLLSHTGTLLHDKPGKARHSSDFYYLRAVSELQRTEEVHTQEIAGRPKTFS